MNNCDKTGDLMWFNYGKMVIFLVEKVPVSFVV